MKCPKCGNTMRPSKKYPGYYLCDTCRKRYSGSLNQSASSSDRKSLQNIQHAHPRKGSHRKARRKRSNKILLFVLVLLFLICVGIALHFSGLASSENTESTEKNHKTTYSSEETASLNGIDLKILSYSVSKGTKTIKPTDGNVFLIIRTEVNNASSEPVKLNSIYNFRAFYQGEELPYSAPAYSLSPEEHPRLDAVVKANSSSIGYVCFEVPADFDTIELEFRTPIWCNEKILFVLNK